MRVSKAILCCLALFFVVLFDKMTTSVRAASVLLVLFAVYVKTKPGGLSEGL